MKILYLFFIASVCSISSLFSMGMNDLSLEHQRTLKAAQAAQMMEIIFNAQGVDFIEHYRNQFPVMSLEEIQKDEKTYTRLLKDMNGNSNQTAAFKQVVKKTEDLLTVLRQAKYSKMSFVRRHSTLLIIAGVIGGALILYYTYKKLSAAKEESSQQSPQDQDSLEKKALSVH